MQTSWLFLKKGEKEKMEWEFISFNPHEILASLFPASRIFELWPKWQRAKGMISASIGAFQLTLVGVKNTAWYYYVIKMNLEINGNVFSGENSKYGMFTNVATRNWWKTMRSREWKGAKIKLGGKAYKLSGFQGSHTYITFSFPLDCNGRIAEKIRRVWLLNS